MNPTNTRSSILRLLLMCVLSVMSSGPAWSVDLQMPGMEAKDFRLVDLEGKEQTLRQHRGRVVLVYFWNMMCGNCFPREMAEVQDVYDKLHDKEFVVLTVFEDPNSVTSLPHFIKQYGYTFPVLIDQDWRVAKQLGVQFVPYGVLIDEQGVIRRVLKGQKYLNEPTILDAVARIRG